MEKISWTDRVKNEEVLHRVKEEVNRLTACVQTPFTPNINRLVIQMAGPSGRAV